MIVSDRVFQWGLESDRVLIGAIMSGALLTYVLDAPANAAFLPLRSPLFSHVRNEGKLVLGLSEKKTKQTKLLRQIVCARDQRVSLCLGHALCPVARDRLRAASVARCCEPLEKIFVERFLSSSLLSTEGHSLSRVVSFLKRQMNEWRHSVSVSVSVCALARILLQNNEEVFFVLV